MKKRVLLFFLLAACSLYLQAQCDTLPFDSLWLQSHFSATLLKARKLKRWHIPAGNYSGITSLGNDHYAVVTDKPRGNGFYEFEIRLNSKGKIMFAKNLGFRADSIHTTPRDMEGIVYVPKSNTMFISAESDQEILEYTRNGQLTGRKLNIPNEFGLKNIQANYGFESLAYSPATSLFWTTTESTILSDRNTIKTNIDKGEAYLRLQSFTTDFQSHLQFAYKTDVPIKHSAQHKAYCFGVPEITALPDGSLLVLEREFYVAKHYLGSFVETKIYRVYPTKEKAVSFADSLKSIREDMFLKKMLVTEFRTSIPKIANYEGMCLGPTLPEGTHTLLLLSDSQDNYGKFLYHLRDRIRVILLK